MKTNDFINKQVVIDGFYEMASNMDYLCTVNDYIEWLEQLSSIQPEWHWIPCSERLPEEKSGWKNVTVIDESGDTVFRYSSVGYYLSDGCWIVDNEPMEDGELIRVIAWMPLPEPWKGEE